MNIIVIGAHPDDCEGRAAGTAIKWAQRGHKVKFLSVTNGDAGHQNMGGGHLARIRRSEALKTAKMLGIEGEVLENHDGELMPTLDVRKQIIRQIRLWNADLVLTHRPWDYHPDHRYTSILVQDAAYMVIVPNVCSDVPPLSKNPVFMYLEDGFTNPLPFDPDVVVPVDDVFDQMVCALHNMTSQYYEWLPWTAGRLDQVPKKDSERRAWLASWFRRRRRNAFPEKTKVLYGDAAAQGMELVECFQICEYGSRPTKQQLQEMFPFAPKYKG